MMLYSILSFPRKWESSNIKPMSYYVYILASKRNGTLYIGFTGDLVKRIHEHKNNLIHGFTSKHAVHQLVYFEIFDDPATGIAREKQLKKWKRAWKLELIESLNPEWDDLYKSIC